MDDNLVPIDEVFRVLRDAAPDEKIPPPSWTQMAALLDQLAPPAAATQPSVLQEETG